MCNTATFEPHPSSTPLTSSERLSRKPQAPHSCSSAAATAYTLLPEPHTRNLGQLLYRPVSIIGRPGWAVDSDAQTPEHSPILDVPSTQHTL